ncbi:MAG: hypothetical protein HKL80_11755 [Acidimicrobiales bacterium]|nr:hypothetical protein [Acidimicrobiales bacterium]
MTLVGTEHRSVGNETSAAELLLIGGAGFESGNFDILTVDGHIGSMGLAKV